MYSNATRFAFGLWVDVCACGCQIGEPEGDVGDDDTSETFSAVTASVGGRAEVTASSGLNLRSGPSTSNRIIMTMPHGAMVDVLAKTGDWFSVRYNGNVGWAFGDYLS